MNKKPSTRSSVDSNNSFVWTSASSSDSESDHKVKKEFKDDESESGKNNKKKLQKNLLEKENLDRDKHKKRKLSQETCESEHESPKKKKIKTEPESDLEVKHKIRQNETLNGTSTSGSENLDKENQKSKDDSALSSSKSSIKRKDRITYEDDVDYAKNLKKENTPKIKKVNNKSMKKPKVSATDESDNGVSYDKYSGASSCSEESQSSGSEDESLNKKKSSSNKSNNTSKNKSKQNLTTDSPHSDSSFTETSLSRIDTTQHDISHNISSSKETKRKISQRIEFEDDINSTKDMKTTTISKKLKSYIKENKHLNLFVPETRSDTNLTENDEIWIIRCPKNIDITSFNNKDLDFGNKCKIKLDGQTYEGIVDTSGEDLCIVNSNSTQIIVNNFPINGYINLHKKIPKIHVHEETDIVDNETNFIPLPITKYRHPLLGANYKKAMKIPSNIKARLKADYSTQTESAKKTKKAHKRKFTSSLIEENGYEPSPDSGVHSDDVITEKKKKKKRNHSDRDHEAPPTKKAKRSQNMESAEAWESAQAIEENLFNF